MDPFKRSENYIFNLILILAFALRFVIRGFFQLLLQVAFALAIHLGLTAVLAKILGYEFFVKLILNKRKKPRQHIESENKQEEKTKYFFEHGLTNVLKDHFFLFVFLTVFFAITCGLLTYSAPITLNSTRRFC
jgi:hypothetical protein